MAQGRFTKIVSMVKWIRTSRLSIKNSLPLGSPGPPGSVGNPGLNGAWEVVANAARRAAASVSALFTFFITLEPSVE